MDRARGSWCLRCRHRQRELKALGLFPADAADLDAAWAAKPRTPNGTSPRKPYPTPVLDAVLAAMPGTVAELAIRCGITPESATRAANLLGKQGRAVSEGKWRKTWRRA